MATHSSILAWKNSMALALVWGLLTTVGSLVVEHRLQGAPALAVVAPRL